MNSGNAFSAPMSRRQHLKLWGAAAAAAPLLAACGTGAGTSTTSTGRKNITFVTTAVSGTSSMEDYVKAYNESQDKYEVSVRSLPSQSSSTEVHQQLVQQLSRKDGSIDVLMMDIIWVAEFAAAGWTMDLGKDWNQADRDAFFPSTVAGGTYNGKYTALPFNTSAGLLYHRTDLLQGAGASVPQTWEDLTRTSSSIIASGAAPQGYLWQGKQAEASICDLVEVIASAGGSILSEDGKKATITEDPAVEAVQFLYDSINTTKISPRDTLSWDESPSRQAFWAGNAPFLRMWSHSWKATQDPATSKVAGKVALANLPHFAGGSSASCLAGYQVGISESSRNKEGAVDFLKWVMKPETSLSYYNSFGYAPGTKAFFDLPAMKDNPMAAALNAQIHSGGVARPVTPKYPQVSLALQSALSKALTSGNVKAELQVAKDNIDRILGS
ncbi:ABC transporter substrate-binding protein [Arthrobacter sp. AB6]|uniref:ABC transporter substrate-binding protein n=1 Tax=Arthrobacter sp. AB6 TaxID=2962570 RepID=UPI0028819083|nr:ABC transporter substrate-binding protein [Arthrobacter sp. AB6]MDT0196737.1 ABC transporter substrate-binding protein [Arthrobacter sp. AB6]